MNNVQHSQRKWQTNRLIFSISIPALGFYVLSIVASVYESVPTTTTTQYQYVPTTHQTFMKVYPPVPTTTTHQTFITLLSRRGSQRQVTEMGEYIFKVSFIIILYISKINFIILSFPQTHSVFDIMSWSCSHTWVELLLIGKGWIVKCGEQVWNSNQIDCQLLSSLCSHLFDIARNCKTNIAMIKRILFNFWLICFVSYTGVDICPTISATVYQK